MLIALALDALNRYEPTGIDFHTYLAAAKVGVQNGWSLIYDQQLVATAQKQLVQDQIAQPFLSPPTVAWLTAPLLPLPYSVAYWIWAATNLAAFAAALAWASRSRSWLAADRSVSPRIGPLPLQCRRMDRVGGAGVLAVAGAPGCGVADIDAVRQQHRARDPAQPLDVVRARPTDRRCHRGVVAGAPGRQGTSFSVRILNGVKSSSTPPS